MTIVSDSFSGYANGALQTVDTQWVIARGALNITSGLVVGNGGSNPIANWNPSSYTFASLSQFASAACSFDNTVPGLGAGNPCGVAVAVQAGLDAYTLSYLGSSTAGDGQWLLIQWNAGTQTIIGSVSYVTTLASGTVYLSIQVVGGNPVLTCEFNGTAIAGLNAAAVTGVSGSNGLITDASATKVATQGQPGLLCQVASGVGGISTFQGGDLGALYLQEDGEWFQFIQS